MEGADGAKASGECRTGQIARFGVRIAGGVWSMGKVATNVVSCCFPFSGLPTHSIARILCSSSSLHLGQRLDQQSLASLSYQMFLRCFLSTEVDEPSPWRRRRMT